ncbi:peptidoglycan-recognition protein SC2-like [Frankliniella occidentalis]|uniref:Peptidoglycan-recognition protein SC2-like n=1 Tax=Frankliniella occidentalis TaxID=133901 RepID=A0A6J1T029_FRAOC|nr:peptidoglycan-recognition protein SC2-like [Frankliniella occidentalis]
MGHPPLPRFTYCVALLPAIPDRPCRWLQAATALVLVAVVVVLGILVLTRPGPSDSASQTALDTNKATTTTAAATTTTTTMTTFTVPSTTDSTPLVGSTSKRPFEAEVLVSRGEWRARGARNPGSVLMTPVMDVIVQHTAGYQCATRAECSAEVLRIQDSQMDWRHRPQPFSDIGYNFLVGGDGHAYWGRGWDTVGAHTYGWNTKSIGVGIIGTFTNETAPPALQSALRRLLEWGVSLGKLTGNYKIMGACQVQSSDSPGWSFMEDLRTWSHWSNYTSVPWACMT